jgi:hypothetical protein
MLGYLKIMFICLSFMFLSLLLMFATLIVPEYVESIFLAGMARALFWMSSTGAVVAPFFGYVMGELK